MAVSTEDAKDVTAVRERRKPTYQASQGGHAPGHLREAFGELIETGEMPGADFFFGEERTVDWLIGQLWNCTDIMGSFLCDDLELPQGSTYARGVRAMREHRQFATKLTEQEAQNEAELEALVALQALVPDIQSLADMDSDRLTAEQQYEFHEARKLASDQLRYDAYVKNKAADLLGGAL